MDITSINFKDMGLYLLYLFKELYFIYYNQKLCNKFKKEVFMKNLKMKKISRIVILALSINLIFSNIMPLRADAISGTISFAGNSEINAGETLTDGSLGSTNISGIDLNIFNASKSDPLLNPVGSFVYRPDSFGDGSNHKVICPNVDNTTTINAVPDLIIIKSPDSSEFRLNSMFVIDYFGAEENVKFQGFKDGLSTGTLTVGISRLNYYDTIDFTVVSIFNNVDEIRISNETNTSDGNWIGINNIQIGDPVPPNTAPTVSSIVPQGSPASDVTSVDFGVTFSEAVTGVDISDFQLSATGTAAGTISSVSGSGSSYTVKANSISGAGTLKLDLKGSGTGITDNLLLDITTGFTSGTVHTVDFITPPIWTLNYPEYDAITKNSIDIKAKINEIGNAYYVCLPSGASAPTATQVKAGQASNGTAVTLKGSVALSANTEEIFSITSLAPATGYDIYIVANDNAGNLQTTATKITATTSVIPITDFSVTSNTSTTVSLNWPAATNATGIIIEKSIDNGGTWIMASTTSTITTDSTTATVTGLLQDIVYKFRLVVTGGVNAGTSNEVSQKTNEAASVASVSVPANGTYTVGEDLDFTVNYNEAITVNTSGGTPRFVVTVGSTTKYADYVSGSGTTALTFRYTVESGTFDSDGIVLASSILTNGGILKNASNEDINLTLNNKGNTTLVKVDAVGPKINALNTSGNRTYKLGDKLSFEVSFDENVNVIQNGSDKPYIDITIGSEVVKAEYDSGTGTSKLNFCYTVKSGDKDTNGIDLHYRILSNGGTLEDALGNDSILSSIGTFNLSGIIVDAAAPNWAVDYPQTSTITKNSIDIKVKTDESGNAYFVCVPKGSSQPTEAQVKAGQDATGTNLAVSLKGAVAIIANNENIFSATFLAAATDYDIYVVAEDSLVNLQTTATKIIATTSAIPITNFSATSNTATTASFNWTSAIGATGVIVEQSPTGVENWTTAATGSIGTNASSVIVTGLSPDTEYKFRLVVTGGTNAGASNEVTEITDKVPVVTSVYVPGNGTYVGGQGLDFIVNYDEAVTVNGTPRIVVTVGATTKYADYLSGSGSKALIFRYTVQSGTLDSDGVELANQILPNGGTLKNASDEDVNLNLYGKGSTTLVNVDAVGPQISSLLVSNNVTYKTGDMILVTANLDENTFITPGSNGVPYIELTIGGKKVQAPYYSGSGSQAIKFSYTVVSGELDEDGIEVDTGVVLNTGSLKDAAGNNAVVTYGSVDTSSLHVDAVAPTLINSSISSDKKSITLTFDENIIIGNLTVVVNQISLSTDGGSTYSPILPFTSSMLLNGKNLTVGLKTPLTGSKSRIRIAGNSLEDILGNIQTGAIETNNLGSSINVVEDTALTEINLEGRYLTLTLDGDTFKDATLDKAKFTLNNAPNGTSIKSVSYTDSTHCKVILAYNGFDFDADVTNVSVTVDSSELTKNEVMTSNGLIILATNDAESISIKNDSVIKEGEEDTKVITVTLAGGQFVDNLTSNNWTVTNLPTGVNKGTVTRINANTAQIKLAGNSTQDYDSDITNVAVSCTTGEYTDSNGGNSLNASNGVTLTSKTVGTVTTSSSATGIKYITAIVGGEVISTGNGTISGRGVVYSTSSNPEVGIAGATKVVATGITTGDFTASLTELTPNTTYHARAFVQNEEGINYGDDVSFKTEAIPEPKTTNSGEVLDDNGNIVKGIEVKVTTEPNDTYTAELKSDEAIVIKQADGTISPIGNYSNLGFITDTNSNISISADGKIKVRNLENGKNYEFKVTYNLGGKKIVIGTMEIKVSNTGDIDIISSLIDPYGVITDAKTGEVISGVNVTLYYADTDRNKVAGITPDTEVELPGIAGFKPNDNKNPQISDVNGDYAFMVFPTTDYYIVATKAGYDKYISTTISVEQELVKWDFEMVPETKELVEPTDKPEATSTADNKGTTNAKTGSSVNTTIWIIGCIISMVVAVGIRRKKKTSKN